MSHAVRCCFVYPERSVRTIRRTGFRTHRRNGGVGPPGPPGPPGQPYARKRAPSVHVRNRFHREAAARSFPSKSHIGAGARGLGSVGAWECGGCGRFGCWGRLGAVDAGDALEALDAWTLRRCGRLDASDAGDVGEGTMNNGHGSMIIGCFPNVHAENVPRRKRPTPKTSHAENVQPTNPQPTTRHPHNRFTKLFAYWLDLPKKIQYCRCVQKINQATATCGASD